MEICMSVKWTAGDGSMYHAKSVFVLRVHFSKSSSDKLISSRPQLHPIVCCEMIGSGNTAASFPTTPVTRAFAQGIGEA